MKPMHFHRDIALTRLLLRNFFLSHSEDPREQIGTNEKLSCVQGRAKYEIDPGVTLCILHMLQKG